MKMLFLVFLLFTGNGCASTTKKTAPVEETISPQESSAQNSQGANQEPMNPNHIRVRIKVIALLESDQLICNAKTKNVIQVEVQQILDQGASILNLPNKNEVVLMNFFIAPKDLALDTVIEAKAMESLCIDSSKSYFSIISHKILE